MEDQSANPFEILREPRVSEEDDTPSETEPELDEEQVMSTNTTTVSFGNLSIQVNATKAHISDDGEEILYPKEDRTKLSSDNELSDLFRW